MQALAGFAGMVILYFFYDYIFIEHKGIPVGNGYYGLLIFSGGMYLSIVLIAYAIGAQKLLRLIAPSFTEKETENDEREKKNQ